jgi:hypothetical protein
MTHELQFTSCVSSGPGQYRLEAQCSCRGASYRTVTTKGAGRGRQVIRDLHRQHMRQVAEKEVT